MHVKRHLLWVIMEDPSELRRLGCIMVVGGHMVVAGNNLQVR